MKARALRNIWHNGAAFSAGEEFELSAELAGQLRQAGLVELIEEPKPAEESKPASARPKASAAKKRSKK